RYTNEDPWTLRGLRSNYDARQFAVYGQIGYDFSSRSRLVLGLRAEHLDLAGDGTTSRLDKTTGVPRTPVSFRPRFDDSVFGGKITLERDLTDRHLAFASITRGYKAGGINIDARINPPADPLTYDTEY